MGLHPPDAWMQRGRLPPQTPMLKDDTMSEEKQAQRVIELDAHPYLFSTAALPGADALEAREEWVLDRVPLQRL